MSYGSQRASKLFPIRHLCVLALVTRKLQDVYKRCTCTYWMTAVLSEIPIFCVRAGCKIWFVSYMYSSKHSSQFFPINYLCVLTRITWKLQVIYGCSARWMTALLLDTFLVWFRVAREIQMESYGSRHISVVLWDKLVCVYCKPICTSLFGAQLCMTVETHVPYDCVLHTKWLLYCHRFIVLQEQSWLATLHVFFSVFSINHVR